MIMWQKPTRLLDTWFDWAAAWFDTQIMRIEAAHVSREDNSFGITHHVIWLFVTIISIIFVELKSSFTAKMHMVLLFVIYRRKIH